MKVPFLDLRAQHATIRHEITPAIHHAINSADFILGEEVELFEEEFAKYLGVRHVIGVSSGLSALELILRANHIGQGDEVILPANTFIATALAVSAVGAKPVLVDIDPATYNIDPDAVRDAITSCTRAILPVHLYGQPADMWRLTSIASLYGLLLIEDACQAHGARYMGQRVGGIGHEAAFSFYPGKNLGAYGDGGAVATNSQSVADTIRQLRNYGQSSKYHHDCLGTNSRLDTLQAAVLRIKLPHLDEWNRMRQNHAAAYGFRPLPHIDHVHHLHVVEVDDRDYVRDELLKKGISTGVHYPNPIHLQPAYAHLGYQLGDFPNTEKAARRVLSLPMFAELTLEQVQYVTKSLEELRQPA